MQRRGTWDRRRWRASPRPETARARRRHGSDQVEVQYMHTAGSSPLYEQIKMKQRAVKTQYAKTPRSSSCLAHPLGGTHLPSFHSRVPQRLSKAVQRSAFVRWMTRDGAKRRCMTHIALLGVHGTGGNRKSKRLGRRRRVEAGSEVTRLNRAEENNDVQDGVRDNIKSF